MIKNHPYYSKLIAKLNKNENQIMEIFIAYNANLSIDDFEYAVNRMFLDMPDKPKNWAVISDILLAYNRLRFCKGDK